VGFISFDNFDSSDQAIEAMNGQYLCGKAITVSYAFKKDGKGGKHGTEAERLLAAQAKKHNVSLAKHLTETQPGDAATNAMAMSIGSGYMYQ
jgi:RNA recognition motif-containing protein